LRDEGGIDVDQNDLRGLLLIFLKLLYDRQHRSGLGNCFPSHIEPTKRKEEREARQANKHRQKSLFNA
jgi:hypothetical protein